MNNSFIAGVGTIKGGEYDKLSVSGTGNIDGNIKANEVKVSGVANFKGTVEAASLKVSGVGKFSDEVKCKTIFVSGVAKIDHDLSADSITVNGTIHIDGDVNSDILVIDTKESYLRNIYGDCINIKSTTKTKIEEIEATNVSLYNVKAKRISGNKIEILGCSNVEVVEFSESLKIHDTCIIGKIIKL